MLRGRRLQDVFKTSSVRLLQDECLLGHIAIFFKNHAQNVVERLFPDPFLKSKN